MEKSNDSSEGEVYYSCDLPRFELKFLAWPPFANLSEQGLNQLVEQRHSALGDGPNNNNNNNNNNNKLVYINLSRLVIHWGNFRDNFLSI